MAGNGEISPLISHFPKKSVSLQIVQKHRKDENKSEK
jgi:hypothetical protein